MSNISLETFECQFWFDSNFFSIIS